jgi:hypothetical protein
MVKRWLCGEAIDRNSAAVLRAGVGLLRAVCLAAIDRVVYRLSENRPTTDPAADTAPTSPERFDAGAQLRCAFDRNFHAHSGSDQSKSFRWRDVTVFCPFV